MQADRIIDSHQHFWQLKRADYGWLTAQYEAIYQDFLPADYAPFARQHKVLKTVLVQAAPTLAETLFLLDLSEQSQTIGAVVGWIDFDSPNAIEPLHKFMRYTKFRGVRPMLQDIEQSEWILKPEFANIFEFLIANKLSFDALIQPRHLAVIDTLAKRYPDLKIIVDHAAKPSIKAGEIQEWKTGIDTLGQNANVSCKLSGLLTEAAAGVSYTTLLPYFEAVYQGFGMHRVMYGSDWPVLNLAGSMDVWIGHCERFMHDKTDEQQSLFWYDNAVRIYQI